MLERQISNRYLNESRVIKAKTYYELENKVKRQKQQWKEKQKLLRMKNNALKNTAKALSLLNRYRSLLLESLEISHIIDWESFYDQKNFDLEEPELKTYINKVGVPKEDKFIEFFFPFVRKKREEKQKEAERLFQLANTEYLYEKNRFNNDRNEKYKEVNTFKRNFDGGEIEAIERYFTMILNDSPYPEGIIISFNLGYDIKTKNLIIEYSLPNPNNLPNVVEYKYVQTRKEIDIKKMKQGEFKEYYNDVLYQITLRTIYECFISDYPQHLDSMVFNGWVQSVDSATGKEFNSRIISIMVKKDDFLSVNLQRVIAKDCFRKLNGQSAGSLYNLSPIKPILELNKNDKRFIETRDILSEINSIPNIAEMEWDEFEHLVTNLFSIYFKNIGEVKITKKSREGGVDGIIFDPDPIRGGKYLIQAKRYNDIVPPSAVRELNGAKDHEKATRGILITTGYFGPDSRLFASENNITLIDGSNIVSMLEDYGYYVRCEIKNGKKKLL